MKNNTIVISVILMISNVIVKFMGLFRDVALANTYGTSFVSDAYIVANNIPIVIFSVVATAISTCFIPIYCEISEKEGEEKAKLFMSNFMNILLVISLVLTLLGELFPGILVKMFAYGFVTEQYNLTIQFTRILLPSIIVIALMSISGSYLQINKDFLPISYVTIPNNLIVIVAIYFSFYSGKTYLLAIGTLIGCISQFIYYYPFLKKNNYKHIWYIDIKDHNIKKVILMVAPVFVSAAVTQINTIVDRSLVSGLQTGSIAALNYSSKLIGFVTGVFIVSLMTIIYPKMSEFVSKNKKEEMNKYVITCLNLMTIILLPIIIVTFISSKEIVRIIFERGSFTGESTEMTSIALAAYSIGLIGIGYREILTKAFFSFKDTKTPMINGALAVVINIILNVILIKKIGFVGSALSTSIVSIITSLLLIINLKKYIKEIVNIKMIINTIKIFISAIGIIPLLVYSNIYIQKKLVGNIRIIIIISTVFIISIIIYILLLIILKEKETKKIIEKFKTRRLVR